jgi:hypothetical protein
MRAFRSQTAPTAVKFCSTEQALADSQSIAGQCVSARVADSRPVKLQSPTDVGAHQVHLACSSESVPTEHAVVDLHRLGVERTPVPVSQTRPVKVDHPAVAGADQHHPADCGENLSRDDPATADDAQTDGQPGSEQRRPYRVGQACPTEVELSANVRTWQPGRRTAGACASLRLIGSSM